MTASTTGLASSSRGASSAAIRSSACATSRAEYKRRALRRASRTPAGSAGGSTLERERRARADELDERAGFLPVSRGMQSLPIETTAAVQPGEPQLRGRIDVTLQGIEHGRHLLRRIAEQHEVATGLERELHARRGGPGDGCAGHAQVVGDHGAFEVELVAQVSA